ncbi:MAG: trehalase family glycosidase [Candidatus Saccharibacteria bacterium]
MDETLAEPAPEISLLDAAKNVLKNNYHEGQYTIPAHGLYPHQWLWDSCFIAIGLCNYDVERAQQEILRLLEGQWANGMLPSMILNKDFTHRPDREFWRSYISPFAPDKVATSGITQPPMLAEAIVRIGKKLPLPARRTWFGKTYPALLKYHQWLYAERDPHHTGLTLQIHPWETGLDNTPPWIDELHQNKLPFWVSAMHFLKLDRVFTFFRRDVHFLASSVEQRMSTVDVFTLYSIQRRLRRKGYEIERVLNHSMITIEDLTFNCIFARANQHLRYIARTAGRDIDDDLDKRMHRTEQALEELWDNETKQFYSRSYSSQRLIKIPTIASLMPLYSGSISKEKAKELVTILNSKQYQTKYPVPTVPTDSEWFHPHMYWQGPTWLNTNWLLADGLQRYGYKEEAKALRAKSIEMVTKSGFYEYFSPLDGSPAGTNNFSWTAAVVIDFLND